MARTTRRVAVIAAGAGLLGIAGIGPAHAGTGSVTCDTTTGACTAQLQDSDTTDFTGSGYSGSVSLEMRDRVTFNRNTPGRASVPEMYYHLMGGVRWTGGAQSLSYTVRNNLTFLGATDLTARGNGWGAASADATAAGTPAVRKQVVGNTLSLTRTVDQAVTLPSCQSIPAQGPGDVEYGGGFHPLRLGGSVQVQFADLDVRLGVEDLVGTA